MLQIKSCSVAGYMYDINEREPASEQGTNGQARAKHTYDTAMGKVPRQAIEAAALQLQSPETASQKWLGDWAYVIIG
jgi:hypothetical protein